MNDPAKRVELAPELLTTAQAAKLCGIGERTLWRLSHSGRAPAAIKLGAAARYRLSDLREWIAAGCPRVDGRGDR